ncbi:MAG: hypothetical protein VCB42_10600 [Myxococcota bacterium]
MNAWGGAKSLVLAGPAALLTAAPALAAGDAEGGSDWGIFFWELLNLALLIGAIIYLGRRGIRDYFTNRRIGIRNDLDQATQLLKEAEDRYATWEAKLADLDSELQKIRETEQRRVKQERGHLLEEARLNAERIAENASALVERELRRAEESLRREASELAVEMAARYLSERVNDDDRKRLMDEFITRVEETRASDGAGR